MNNRDRAGDLRKRDSFQTVDDVLNDVREALEHGHEKRALQDRPLAESYARHGLTLICDLEVRMPLEPLASHVRIDHEPITYSKFNISLVYRANPSNEMKLSVCNQEPVFVFDVEVMEPENNLSLSSFVGLYGLHQESLDLFAGILFQAIDGSFKVITGFADREFREVVRDNDGLKPSVIQSRPKIVDCIAEYQEKRIGELLSRRDAERIVSAFKVSLDPQMVRVSISECLPFSLKVVNVLFGPF
ncbi:MAG TPA: hypothetical protein VNU94_06100 [Acidobacteriaceae bacterium]|nr:hypothetical protein [Acidobacteriaceae bacterium]